MIAFAVIAVLILAAASVPMCLRNLVHSVLLLVGCWAGIAAFYLWAGAEFVAFAQLLVYVGAVSMLSLFAVLLTRRSFHDLDIAPDWTEGFVSCAAFDEDGGLIEAGCDPRGAKAHCFPAFAIAW